MNLSLSIGQKLEIKISQSIDFPKVVEDIKGHFKDNESGDVRNLKTLLKTIPQRQNGKLAYVIGGGWAVEVLTGKARDHGNINVLVVDPNRTTLESNRCLDYLGVQYLENALQRALIKKDIIRGDWKRGKCTVYVPSREFMIGTKMLPRTAEEGNRDKDIEDVVNLLAKKPDMKKLTKVFNALPYIKNPESVACVVYGISDSGLRSKAEDVLRCLNAGLREQLVAYGDRINLPRAEKILETKLSRKDNLILKNYHKNEAPGVDFFDWLRENRYKLIGETGRIFHPAHPGKVPKYFYLSDLEEDNSIIDKEAFDVIYNEEYSKDVFAVLSVKDKGSSLLQVWNPNGKLIYENWRNE